MEKISSLRFGLLGVLALLHTTTSSPLLSTEKIDKRQDPATFVFSSIGDSWAAGPATIPRDAYGGPATWTPCARSYQAWEALMAGDNTWTNDPITFNFEACSGAKMVDATDKQLSQVGQPNLLTMQLGGNNVHFSDIAKACIYVGDVGVQKDYPDPLGTCFQTIAKWEAYLDAPASAGADKSFYFDHNTELQAILASDNIVNRDDFYFYIVGYAEFFNTKSPDSDWCNNESFGVFKAPKLSNALRSKINELTVKTNGVMAQSTSDIQNDHVKFWDPSPSFETHRFCEPGQNLNNQYFLHDVYFWNLTPPEDDDDYAALSDTDARETAWAENHIFFNGTKATPAQLETLLDSGGSSSGRTFHPKLGGHYAIKDGLILFLRDNNVPGIKPAAPPPPPPEKQPYANGEIHIHINEFWDCNDASDNLSVQITMWDSTSTQIGYLPRTQAGASKSATMGSKLEDELIITPEWAKGGYIQFQLGDLAFDTNIDTLKSNPNGVNKRPIHCRVGGYNPRQGPRCFLDGPGGPTVPNPGAYALNQIDCSFPSPTWHGGPSSDGS